MEPLTDSEAAWVTEYFSEDYLRIYQFPEERTGPEVAFLTRELGARILAGGRVLDLACGQGRHAVPLAAAGFSVVGLDFQEPLLREARLAAERAGVSLPLVRGDMRALPFSEEFDAVINVFTAFGYFSDEENARVIAEIARALRPGGFLIIDLANRDALLRRVQERSWRTLPDGSLLLNEWQWDPISGRYTYPQILVTEKGTKHFTHTVRLYTCTEISDMLRRAGFQIEAYHGGFNGEALTMDAPRMIVIARRNSS